MDRVLYSTEHHQILKRVAVAVWVSGISVLRDTQRGALLETEGGRTRTLLLRQDGEKVRLNW